MFKDSFPTRDDRIRRLGQLLSKGVTLMLGRELTQHTSVPPGIPDIPAGNREKAVASLTGTLDATEHAIVRLVEKLGSASPRDIQVGLELPKTTAFRKLQKLVGVALLERSGRTTAIRYKLSNFQRKSTGLHTAAFDSPKLDLQPMLAKQKAN